MADLNKRYIVIHGHFYQPPRENPWTGLVAPEPGAAPFANWNERILSEAYAANAHAHTMEGTVVRIHNNYESLNFDLGPTLSEWLAKHGKSAYRMMVRADDLSCQRHGGHGNAIAQSYNHSILPLLPVADQEVQLAWGMADFVFRFKRPSEGLWLPECAADPTTLATLARAGIKYVILAPWQGEFRCHGHDDGAAGPFIWREGESSLSVFRFDRELAGYISFGEALKDGANLAQALSGRAHTLAPGATLLVATDGETFGHHKKSGAAELARALEILNADPDLVVTNAAEVLRLSEPVGSFELHGASSWSCAHGVERWRSDCGCRLTAGTSQHWRAPLREALEAVKRQLDGLYLSQAHNLVKDPMAALREAIVLALDPAGSELFWARHGLSREADQERFTTLFEIQRAAHAMFTSCAWFFDDFGGLEGRIVLRWAARALELAASLAPSLEPELIERLRPIHSNRREIGDAATLYLSLKAREARGRG